MKEIAFDNFLQTLDLIPTGVFIADSDGKIEFWNHWASFLTGIDSSLLVNKGFDSVLAMSDAFSHPVQWKDIKKLLKTPQPAAAIDVWISCPSGNLVHVRLFAAQLHDGEGKDRGVAMIFHDVVIEEILGEALEASEKTQNMDFLTRLWNKKSLFQYMQEQFENIRRHRYQLALLFMDIDHFKEINDRYGHVVGDQVLEQFGKFLKSHIRRGEKVFRYGGDEFVIMPLIHSPAELEGFLSRFQKELSQVPFPIPVSVSMGHTFLQADDTAESALERADKHMYENKKRKGISTPSQGETE
ncbi:MAG TPA: diguanylate cyclase [Thermotogota bacterium]|nr:diguanylate cyclase [Thermotogota bacterium]HRW91418.1 diguanylate cyclase [Thermotogota bacterium]